jgi:hypothetical protein
VGDYSKPDFDTVYCICHRQRNCSEGEDGSWSCGDDCTLETKAKRELAEFEERKWAKRAKIVKAEMKVAEAWTQWLNAKTVYDLLDIDI